MADHSPQAEITRAVKVMGLDPRVPDSAMKPGDTVSFGADVLAPLSLYVHIPTPEGIVGRNIVGIVLERPAK